MENQQLSGNLNGKGDQASLFQATWDVLHSIGKNVPLAHEIQLV